MTLPFTHYTKIKDRYCICYFGPSNEYLQQLFELRPALEIKFPELELYIGYRDSASYIADKYLRTIPQSKIKERNREFSYIRQITSNLRDNPIEQFATESEVEFFQSTNESNG